MEKNWMKTAAANEQIVADLKQSMNISPVLLRILAARGVTNKKLAKKFFRPQLEDLHDPFLMKDMDKAVERLTRAVHAHEKVLVYGDYDVDGTTAVTVVFSFLKYLGVNCDYYIPDRYAEGYGFSFASVEYAKQEGFQLIITLDCGVRDGEKIKKAGEYGIDVIVCDHHQPAELPPAVAVLDPKRSDCEYPFKGLSGCGVGFKMLQAFCMQHDIPQEKLYNYLDLLTISIGADIVPMVDENRVFAHFGLKQLAAERRPGIAAMLEQAGFQKKEMTITDVVFLLAPRINAAGRIFSGKQAVELLLCEDAQEAKRLSKLIEENNKTRKNLDKVITAEALAQIIEDPERESSFSNVVAGRTWHKGVVGIVASRIVEAHYKPAIVLVDDGEKMSGSARSIESVDLFEALEACSDLLIQFGGHAMAAGLSLRSENFTAFKAKFNSVVLQMLNGVKPVAAIVYNDEIGFDDITPNFHKILKEFAPFGPGNMHPVFLATQTSNARYTKTVGERDAHLKLHVKQRKKSRVEMAGIGFDLGSWNNAMQSDKEVDLLFTIDENEWKGRKSIQLMVKVIRFSETAEVFI